MAGKWTTILSGVFWTLVSCALWYQGGFLVVDEINFSKHGRIVPGKVVGAEETFRFSRRNRGWRTELDYEYEIPDGTRYTARCRLRGRIEPLLRRLTTSNKAPGNPTPAEPCPIEVEYLPDDPANHRIKGSVRVSNLVVGAVVSTLLALHGVLLLRRACREQTS